MGNGEGGMNIDLGEEVVGEAVRAMWPKSATLDIDNYWYDKACDILEAITPIIARQVAELIAAAIEAEADRRRRVNDETAAAQGGMRSGMAEEVRLGHDLAAQIAREAVR